MFVQLRAVDCVTELISYNCFSKETPEGVVVVLAKWADLEDSLRIGANSNVLIVSLDGEVNFKSGTPVFKYLF